jgi:hypothetical protein
MDIFLYIYRAIDDILMPFCRFPDNHTAGYLFGTLVLASMSVLVGKLSVAVIYRFNKEKIADNSNEIYRFHDLSVKALKAGNKAAFEACNSIANESYGKSFFQQVSLSASFLWPAFIAMGWMQYRFSNVEFILPFTDISNQISIGYISTYVLCYVCALIIFNGAQKIFFLMRNQ